MKKRILSLALVMMLVMSSAVFADETAKEETKPAATEEKKDEAKADEKKEEAKADEKKEEAKADEKKEEAKADEKKEEAKADEKKEEAKPEEKKAVTFTDVKEGDWFAPAVKFAAEAGLFAGMPDGTFAPAGKITRAQFVTVLGRKAGVEKAAEGEWYAAYVKWAVEKKLVMDKTEENFMPSEEISREEMAYILNAFLATTDMKMEGAKEVKFADEADMSDWAKEAITMLAKNEVLSGKGENKFAPKETLTRAEVAQILFNLYAPKADEKKEEVKDEAKADEKKDEAKVEEKKDEAKADETKTEEKKDEAKADETKTEDNKDKTETKEDK